MTDLFTASFDEHDNPRSPSAPISLSSSSPLPVKGETRARPLHISPTPADVDLTPFWVGCNLLRLRRVGPQQVELARVLLAEEAGVPLYSELVVEEPRRASKTTTIWAVLLGLCATRPDFRVVTTAQSYVKARERYLEVYRALAPHNVGDYELKRGAAEMVIEWTNGSRLWVVTPEGGAFRGDGADRIFLDEAQEHGPEATADILGGALALMDTRFHDDADLTDENARSDGQLIVSGTAGKVRAGMLWDFLERGRAGQIGIVEYAIPEGTPVAFELDSPEGRAGAAAGWQIKGDKWVLNEPAVIAAHPGVGTLTTLRVIRDRFTGMDVAQFSREYGGLWPFDLNTRAINAADWAAGTVDVWPPMPARYALGYDVAPDQSSAALCAAWRDEQGRAWIEVIEHNAGDGWLPKAIYTRTRARTDLRVGYDRIGPNQAVADRLHREARPRPKLVDLSTRDTTAAAALVATECAGRRLMHRTDPALDNAAEVATRRPIGDGSWAWGRRRATNAGGDITALVAASSALKVYDTHVAHHAHRPAGTGLRIRSTADVATA